MKITSLTNLFEHAGIEIEFTRLVAGQDLHQYVLVLRSKTLGTACYYKSKISTRISLFNAQEMTLLFMMGQLPRHASIADLIAQHMDSRYLDHVATFCDGYRRFLVGSDTRKIIAQIINDALATAVNDDCYVERAAS